jgi:hypothetical protein
VPSVIIRTGLGPEHKFRGIIREKYHNGDVKVEIQPGIFRIFHEPEIKSIEPINPK